MILVSLGTHERPFYRLVKEVERLVQEGKIKQQVVIQLGYTDYKVKGAKCFKFIEFNKMRDYIKKCDILITHGGVGSITDALGYGKPVIVVPRRKHLNEHSDDHQMQIARLFSKRTIPVYDVKELSAAIRKSQMFKATKREVKNLEIMRIVSKKIEEWSGQSSLNKIKLTKTNLTNRKSNS